jgi:hypothetical protein
MTQWIESKQYEFVSVDMPEEEASLIQSTITTFSAATASDLETMRNMIALSSSSSSSSSSDNRHHRAGVVQILLEQLKEQVAEPFSRLQKQRTRVAVELWQNPLHCRLYHPKPKTTTGLDGAKNNNHHHHQDTNLSSIMEELLDDDDEDDDMAGRQPRDQRFLPRNPGVATTLTDKDDESFDFLAVYRRIDEQNKKAPPRRPEFVTQLIQAKSKKRRLEQEQKQEQLLQQRPSGDDEESSNSDFSLGEETNNPKLFQQPQQQQPQQKPVHLPYQPPLLSAEDYQHQVQSDLRQEAALLQLSVQTSDLQSVQNVEQRMLEITTLINQFSNLVSEQQEDIEHIHEQAQEVKENITKGQENLVDAAERTKQSKHYMAWSIFAMAMILLFFHTLKG